MANRKAEMERVRQEAEAQRRARARRLRLGGAGILVLLVAAVIVIAVQTGGSGNAPPSAGPPPKLTRAQLAAVPKQLAANLRQANRVIDGSIESKLAALRGVPVVVNQWASWCPNCKAEFPLFQQLSMQFRGKVAFLGLDSQDDRGSAEDFLKEYPVNYPSIFDQSASEAASIGAGRSWPTTIYFNKLGQRTFVRQGGYVTAPTLRADIERYALQKG